MKEQKFFTLDPTDHISNKIDRERLREEALRKAKKFFAKNRIKENSFKKKEGGNYDESIVDEDIKGVEKIENFLGEQDAKSIENNEFSEIFNAMVLELLELANWMGQNNFTIVSSKYDKYKTGIGGIIEFNTGGISYLGVNITSNSDFYKLKEKLNGIKLGIKEGKLSKIKYFNSESRIGEFKEIPKVIVGCDRDMFLDVIELWLRNDTKALSEHPLLFLILDQVKKQVEFFKKEAVSVGDQKLDDMYGNILNNINKILESKSELREKLENPKEGDSLKFKEEGDGVSSSLKQALEVVF